MKMVENGKFEFLTKKLKKLKSQKLADEKISAKKENIFMKSMQKKIKQKSVNLGKFQLNFSQCHKNSKSGCRVAVIFFPSAGIGESGRVVHRCEKRYWGGERYICVISAQSKKN